MPNDTQYAYLQRSREQHELLHRRHGGSAARHARAILPTAVADLQAMAAAAACATKSTAKRAVLQSRLHPNPGSRSAITARSCFSPQRARISGCNACAVGCRSVSQRG